MKNIIKFTMGVLLALSLCCGTALAQTDAQTLVETKVNEVMTKLDSFKGQNVSDAQKMAALEGIIFEVFDLTEMSKRALGINYNKFNDEQKKEFEKLFAEMLEDIYLSNIISAYSDQKVVYGKPITLKANEAVEIPSEIIFSDGKKTPINYRLSNKTGQWLGYDVIIEGISFIKNYRDQFRDLLTKNSPQQLLDIMRQKNEAFEAGLK